MKYTIVADEDGNKVITVFETTLHVADQTHPRFNAILEGVLAGDPSVVDLFDLSVTVVKKFEKLTERVSVSNGNVFFDGDMIDSSIADQIMRFIDAEVDDWMPLVNFLEKVETNPNEHSRTMLYDWLKAKEFTITDEGDMVGYKGVSTLHYNENLTTTDVEGKYHSTTRGNAIVNGVVVNGYIPNDVGFVVEMPRSDVAHDPGHACSTGLHVATYPYATSFGDTILKVYVNPRDVVSVPTDGGGEKVRVCRYYVAEVVDRVVTEPVEYASYEPEFDSSYTDDEEDDDYCSDCGEHYEYCECECEY